MSPSSSVLEPEDGEPFARVHRAHYRGFVVDAPSVLPASLHDDVAPPGDAQTPPGAITPPRG